MEEIIRCLTELTARQQQFTERLATRQEYTDRVVEQLQASVAGRVPLPESSAKAHQCLVRLTEHDDIEAYLHTFEVIAGREGWVKEEWACIIAPFLTGEAQRAYYSLQAPRNENYDELKTEILARVGLTPMCAAQQFFQWTYDERKTVRTQAAHLARLAHLWLLTGSPTADKVAEKVIVDRMLRALPRPLRHPVSMTNPRDLASLVEAVELAEATNACDAGERVGLGPRRVMERRPLEGAPRPVSRSAVPDLIDEPMPTEPPVPTARAWMAGCFLHKEGPSPGPSRMVKLDGKPVQALLDSGSSVTLVQPTLLKPRPEQKTELPLTCVHGDTRYVPARTVRISAEPGTWAVEVGIVRDLPVPLLLGRDWPGFEKLLLTPKNPAASARDRPRRKRRGPPSKRPVYLATDSEREGECQPVNIPSVYFDVFQQVTAGGS